MKRTSGWSIIYALLLSAFALAAHAEVWFRLTPIEDAANPTLVYINDFNNNGEVVGFVETLGTRAFLWRDGRYIDLVNLIDSTSQQTEATGINDRSEIVGHRNDRTPRAFLLRNNRRIDLQAEPNVPTSVLAINNQRQVLGKSGQRVFIWHRPGNNASLEYLPDLPDTGEAGSTAFDIDDSGNVVGVSGPTAAQVPVLWSDGSVIRVPLLPDATRGEAKALNNLGQIVGANQVGGAQRPFLWSAAGGLHEQGRLGVFDLDSQVLDINNWGVMVGYTANSTRFFAVMWVHQRAIDLNSRILADDPLKAQVDLQQASFINDRGQVVARGANRDTGAARMYLLTPVYRPGPIS